MANKITGNDLWIADDGSYGHGQVLLVNTENWTSADIERFDDADEDDKWDVAQAITESYEEPMEETDV